MIRYQSSVSELTYEQFCNLSKKKKHQHDVEALRDIRDFAKAEVSHDIKLATDDVVHMGKSVKHIAHDVSSIFSGEAFGLAGLIPIIQSILKRK